MDANFKGNRTTALLLLGIALVVSFIVGREFMDQWKEDTIAPLPAFERRMLSDYFPGLKESGMDTPVFVQRGSKPGGSVLVLGGTHPNEPSSYMTAVLLLENAKVEKGSLFVIPFGNISGFSNTLTQDASPNKIHFKLADGSTRAFRYGSRDTNPITMWPIPDIYVHKASGQELSGNESKNLNRAYPGDPEGTPTEKLAYAIVQLLKKENITLAFDLHEASPEYPVVDAIVAHENSMELAAAAAMEIKGKGIEIRLEPSPKNLRGLSHREWGDATQTLPILLETANPSQGRLRGRTDENLVLIGKDKSYEKSAKLGRLFVPFDEEGKPLDLRVARHVTTIANFVEMLDIFDEEHGVVLDNVPTYEEINKKGIGAFLNPLPH